MLKNRSFLHLHPGELYIHLIIVLLPTYLIRFQLLGLPLNVLDILITGLFVAFYIHVHGKVQLDGWRTIMASFAAIGAISVLVSPDPVRALGLYKSVILLPMLVGIMVLTTRPALTRVLTSFSWLLGFVAIVAIIQWLTGYGIPAPWNTMLAVPGTELRVTSIFEYPNAIGLLFAPIVAMLLAWAIHEPQQRATFGLVALLGLLLLVLAKTDGAFVAIAAAVFVTLLRTKWKLVVITLGIVAVGVGLSVEPIRNVLLFQDTSGEVRLALWQGTVNLLQHNPIVGSGLGGFDDMYPMYKLDRHVESLQYAHNIVLDFWVQLGILGLIWFLVVLIRTSLRLVSNTALHASIVLAGIIAIVIYGLVDVPYFKNDLAVIFWILITLASTLTYRNPLTRGSESNQ